MDLIPSALGSLLFGLGLLNYLSLAWRRSRLPLGQAIRALWRPPAFSNEADNRRAGVLTALLQPNIAVLILVVPALFIIRRDRGSLIYVLLTVWGIESYLTLYLLARRGRLRLAGWLLPAIMFLLVTLSLPSGTGTAGLALYGVIVVAAGVLLGGRGALVYAGLSALILAERIRELAQASAPGLGEYGAPLSGYTLSLGVATLPADALSAGQLLLAADNAELAAKHAGKNRVCAAEPLVPGS